MTRESSLWATFKGVLPVDAHAVRVENSVEVGTPDVNLCLPPAPVAGWASYNERPPWDGWIELKVQEAPKRKTTKFRCEHFTMEQRQWLVDRTRAGGNAYMLLQVPQNTPAQEANNRGPVYLWLRGDIAAVWIGECTFTELVEKAAWSGDSLDELVREYFHGH